MEQVEKFNDQNREKKFKDQNRNDDIVHDQN